MSRERRLIDDGLLCRFYGFTLTEARALDIMDRDVYIRYLNLVNEVSSRAQDKQASKYG